MIEILKKFNYYPPPLKEYSLGNIKVVKTKQCFTLFVDDYQWNNYNFMFHDEAFQVFPHYFLAKGHCICTGLGFGVREQWLLKNPLVSKVTVIEKNVEVLNYHKWLNNPLLNYIDIIIGDADKYVGECDTLLLDHYEQESDNVFLNSLETISKNIKHSTAWVWSIEPYVEELSFKNKCSIFESYNKIKNHLELKLPNLNEETLTMLFFMFFSRQSFLKKGV